MPPRTRPCARTRLRAALRGAALALAWLLMLGTALWGTLALGLLSYARPALRTGLAGAFALAALAALAGFIPAGTRRRACLGHAGLFCLALAAWACQRPSNDRPWQAETAVAAYATVAGDLVTVHRVRNFDYRTETDFTPAYYDRTYDLRALDSVDLVASYWMGPDIAHIFLTFGFAGGEHLAFSIEARKPRGEAYSSFKGLFRQYELFYLAADERDVLRVRTTYRKDPPEQVHLYPLRGPAVDARRLFLEYVRELNDLREHPRFYNTLTTNCTSSIWMNTRINPGHLPFSWKILLSGHVPEYLAERGKLRGGLVFPELQRRSLINALAQAADRDAGFSRRIRQGFPS